MRDSQGPRGGTQIKADLAEAVLHSGFALVRFAEAQANAGAGRNARRALVEAREACSEGRSRLFGLNHDEVQRVRTHANELRDAIQAADLKVRLMAPEAESKVIVMPCRGAAGG